MTDWFRPGQKVVCINDQWSKELWMGNRPPPCPLVLGEVYTIKAVELNGYENSYAPAGSKERALNLTILSLLGVRNPCDVMDFFCASRFMPEHSYQEDASSQEKEEIAA